MMSRHAGEPAFRIERLNKELHDRQAFEAGEPSITRYLRRYARQNQDLGLGVTYVVTTMDEPEEKSKRPVLGYYTISSGEVATEDVPEQERTHLPRYPVPVIRLGRLGVDQSMQGQGLGELLLVDALKRSGRIAEGIGAYAVEVDALNDEARSFYQRFGFESLEDDKDHLYLPIVTAQKLANQWGSE